MKHLSESGLLGAVPTSFWIASIRKEIESDFARCASYLVAAGPKARGPVLNHFTYQMWWEAGHQAATSLRKTYDTIKAGTVDVGNFQKARNRNRKAVEESLGSIILEKMKAEAHRFYLKQSANLKFSHQDVIEFFRCSDFEAKGLIKYLRDKVLVTEIKPGTFQVNEGCLEIGVDGYGRKSLCDAVCGQFAKGFPNKGEAFDSFELLLEVAKDMEVVLKHLNVEVQGKEAGTCNLRKYFRELEKSSKERVAKTGEDTSDNVAFPFGLPRRTLVSPPTTGWN